LLSGKGDRFNFRTSIIYELVSPTERLKTIHSLTDRYFVKNQSFEDSLEYRDGSVVDDLWKKTAR